MDFYFPGNSFVCKKQITVKKNQKDNKIYPQSYLQLYSKQS